MFSLFIYTIFGQLSQAKQKWLHLALLFSPIPVYRTLKLLRWIGEGPNSRTNFRCSAVG